MGSPKDEPERERFDEGAEEQHEVEISRAFYLGAYEVTQWEYEKVMGRNPSVYSKTGFSRDRVKDRADTGRFPVEFVSWDEAVEFCRKLTVLEKEKKTAPRLAYTLPTEAEWEYACRGGPNSSTAPFHFKKPSQSLSSGQANFWSREPYNGGRKGEPLLCTCPVGSYEANRLGLQDMHGNVWEWTADWYSTKNFTAKRECDPRGPKEGKDRILRGGDWSGVGWLCRAAYRLRCDPRHRGPNIGFRVLARAP